MRRLLTAAAVFLSLPLTLAPATAVRADVLYGIDASDASIFTLDTVSAMITKYFGHPASSLGGLDFDAAGNLYLEQFGNLYLIPDLSNPSLDVAIGSSNGRAFESFEIVGSTGYAADVFDGNLYSVDLATNAATSLGSYGNSSSRITGLASDDSLPRFYGARIFQNDIIEVSPTGTNLGTVVSGLPGSVTSLAYGSAGNLWFIPAFGSTLYSADPVSGSLTIVLTGLGLGHVTGLTASGVGVPEPATLFFFGVGALALSLRRRPLETV